MSKVLIDTNVLIYALDKDSVFNKKATNILTADLLFYTTSKNISEYFAVSSKLKFDNQLVWSYYHEIRNNISILFPTSQSLEVFESLLKKHKPKGNQVFDIEIASIMIANKIEVVATFNKADFKNIKDIIVFN